MRQVANIVVVRVPQEALWDYLANYENIVQTAASTARAKLKSGAPGVVGATYEGALEWEGITSSWVAHLKEAVPPHSLMWESRSHGGECCVRFDLTPINEANTSLSVTVAYGASKPNAPLEPFAWGLMTPLIERSMRKLRELTIEQRP